jgi:oligopeptide transport system ATP-binding protein
MKEPLLTISDLNVSFHSQGSLLHAVRGIHYHVHKEETIGIVGESGCGKSAAAKAIVKLLPSHTSLISGNISYKGQNLLDVSERKMQRIRGKEIGMIFQDPMTSLNPTMRIGEQIREGILRHFPKVSRRTAKLQTIEMLEKVGISSPEERFYAYPHTLSGGLRQRTLIALALVCHPELLIADEVTTALDVTIQAQILDLLQQIKKEMKMSVILITHDMSVVAKFCDRVLVMYAGKIVEDAPVDILFAHPQHPYTCKLLQAIPRLDQPKKSRLLPIEGMPPNLSAPIPGCGFCARCDKAMKICALETPPLREVEPSHFTACFLHDPRLKGNT